jgi:cob(I)alamin adenosyltransferase
MTVNLTRIYTKLGDAGETHLGDMSRVSKLHPRVEAYGTVDELNATLGVALLADDMPEQFAAWIRRVQNDLLDVGADLAVPRVSVEHRARGPSASDEDSSSGGGGGGAERAGEQDPEAHVEAPQGGTRQRLRVGPEYTAWLERACDEVNATLEPLRSFVIPGGTPAAAQLHVCRTVCRRAERRALAVEDGANPEVVRYLNRLSDLLFILSRAANDAPAESLWDPGAHGAHPRRDSPA